MVQNPRPRRCVGPSRDQHVVTYNPEVGLLAVVARTGPQVSGVGVAVVADHVLVQAAIRVGVVVGDLKGGDNAVGVLLDLLGRGFWTHALVCERVLVRVLAGVRVDHRAGCDTAVARVLIPRVVRVGSRVDEELQKLIRGGLGPLLAGECERTSDEGSRERGAESLFVLLCL